jgi:hypothetical protein
MLGLARGFGAGAVAPWRAIARAVMSVPKPLNSVPIALMQATMSPATAMACPLCEDGGVG